MTTAAIPQAGGDLVEPLPRIDIEVRRGDLAPILDDLKRIQPDGVVGQRRLGNGQEPDQLGSLVDLPVQARVQYAVNLPP